MPVGVLNPRDNNRAASTRPAEATSGADTRKWYDDSLATRMHAQDLNQLLAQIRAAGDFYGVTDTEGDDDYLRKAIQEAVDPDNAGAVKKAGDTMSGALTINADGAGGSVIVGRFSADSSAGSVTVAKARGSVSLPAVPQNGDQLGRLVFSGWEAGSFSQYAQMRAVAIGTTPGAADHGARLIYQSAPSGSITQAELFRFDHETGFSMFGANPVIDQNRHIRLRSYTIATLPAASAAAGQMIYCSDLGGGGGQLVSDGTNWRRVGMTGIEVSSVNNNFTLTPLTNAPVVIHTATLGIADRTITLSTTNARNGSRFRIVRTGGGAFNLLVGSPTLKTLATNTWCEVEYDGSAWNLVAYGTL